ncbi:MAG: tRNA/tmRNA/rRNA uracil-C5-methylase (TrmA/RlmC/RlmD family) [Halieaceae bacterium]|jgi:tRNA/tmRNA/rRNA uracil-C5-methylase (TrmA/RlmC/RlmD family)
MAMNLYDEDALRSFLQRQRLKQFDLMLVDPPRKGFPALNDWVNKLKPKRLIYVSCNPASLAADVQRLTGDLTPAQFIHHNFLSKKTPTLPATKA